MNDFLLAIDENTPAFGIDGNLHNFISNGILTYNEQFNSMYNDIN